MRICAIRVVILRTCSTKYHTCKVMKNYVIESFMPDLSRLSHRHYMSTMMGFRRNNCFSETENALLYRDVMGPSSNNKIHISQSKIVSHTNRRNSDIKSRDLANMTRTRHPAESSSAAFDVDVLSLLSKKIVEVPRDKAMEQFHHSKSYRHCLETITKNPENILATFRVANFSKERTYDHIHPVYRRTRTVTFVEVVCSGEKRVCVRCDCDFFICHMCPCRHFYAVVHRPPEVSDFYPQCLHVWGVYHSEGGHEDLTTKLNALLNNVVECGGVLISHKSNPFDDVAPEMASLEHAHFDRFLRPLEDVNLSSVGRTEHVQVRNLDLDQFSSPFYTNDASLSRKR